MYLIKDTFINTNKNKINTIYDISEIDTHRAFN